MRKEHNSQIRLVESPLSSAIVGSVWSCGSRQSLTGYFTNERCVKCEKSLCLLR